MVTDCKSQHGGKGKERRRFGRFASRLPVRTRVDASAPSKQNGEHIPCRLQLRDFSLGGLRVESPRPLEVNEPVTVSLPPGDRHPAVHLTGRVVHCCTRDDGYEVGIQFRERERDPQRSPYLGLPRLFSMASEFEGTIRRERDDEP